MKENDEWILYGVYGLIINVNTEMWAILEYNTEGKLTCSQKLHAPMVHFSF